MREITTKVYTFDELTDKAKENARDWYRQGALDHEWWESVCGDAERVGLKIKEVGLGCAEYADAHVLYVEADFMASAEETAHKIETEHGETRDTLKTAKAYLKQRDELIDTWPKDENGDLENEYQLDAELDILDSDFLCSLQEDYLVILEKEAEYLTSDEVVDESIRANGYEFTADGKRA